MAKKTIAKYVLVCLESLAGTGHKRMFLRPRDQEKKFEGIFHDPLVREDVLYKQIKKLRSIGPKKRG